MWPVVAGISTGIYTFLVGHSNKPSFATDTGVENTPPNRYLNRGVGSVHDIW